jgi:hypothetical protein
MVSAMTNFIKPSERAYNPFFSCSFENDIVQMMAMVLNTHLQTISEILHHLASHFRWDCCSFLAYCSLQVVKSPWSMFVHFCFEIAPEKKSQGVRSGERAGHPTSPRNEIRCCGNISFKTSIVLRAVCAVAPSCWNILDLPNLEIQMCGSNSTGPPQHTARRTMEVLKEMFPQHLISLRGDVRWPARSPDLTPCDFFFSGALSKLKCTNIDQGLLTI